MTKVSQDDDISRQVDRTFSKVKTSGMRSKFAVILHTSVYMWIRACRYVCTISTYACTYVFDSRWQLDSNRCGGTSQPLPLCIRVSASSHKGAASAAPLFSLDIRATYRNNRWFSLPIWTRYWPWPWWPGIVSFFYG